MTQCTCPLLGCLAHDKKWCTCQAAFSAQQQNWYLSGCIKGRTSLDRVVRVHSGHDNKVSTCEGAVRAGARMAPVRASVPTCQLLATQLATAEACLAAPGCLAYFATVTSSFHLCEGGSQYYHSIIACNPNETKDCQIHICILALQHALMALPQ